MTEEKKIIVVTGGAGFVGSNLVEALVQNPAHRVISLDNYFTGSKENHIEGTEYIKGDTRDIATLIQERPALVYHLGEYARVEQSFEDIEIVWDYNVAGTHAVLEFCRHHGAKLVYAGSSTKFGDGGLGINQSPYAWTKAANTELVKNYGTWFSVPFAITYFYNVYGPRERSGKYGTVIEIFRQLHKAGKALPVREPGDQRRNFTHVYDIVSGLLLIGEKGEGDEFGLGHEQSFSILEVAELFGGEIEWLQNRPGNRFSASLDTTKARALGWEPVNTLEAYIAQTR